MTMPSTYEILLTAFKTYCKENGTFLNQPPYVDIDSGDTRTIYATYDNCIELSKQAELDGRKITDITGSYELLQINLGFEYDVQYTFTRKAHLEDTLLRKQLDEKKREGHLNFVEECRKNEEGAYLDGLLNIGDVGIPEAS